LTDVPPEEEFSYQEIAEIVGCPVGTVRSHLHRGSRMLQKALWDVAEQQGIVADLHANEE
jgi:RNA polymerase sigma-70 factor, ECF subfamily